MVYLPHLTGAAAFALFATSAIAHPGEHHDENRLRREIEAREFNAHKARRSLEACSGTTQARDLKKRSIERRVDAVKNLRKKRNIQTSESAFPDCIHSC